MIGVTNPRIFDQVVLFDMRAVHESKCSRELQHANTCQCDQGGGHSRRSRRRESRIQAERGRERSFQAGASGKAESARLQGVVRYGGQYSAYTRGVYCLTSLVAHKPPYLQDPYEMVLKGGTAKGKCNPILKNQVVHDKRLIYSLG